MAGTPVYLIDASIYIFKYYFALPPNWISVDDFSTEAVYGFTTFLLKFLAEQQPEYVAVCFDGSLEQCFRNKIYPGYKSSRVLPDEALAYQLKACRTVAEQLGLACFSSPRFEADDLLATLAHQLRDKKHPVVVISRDKDLGQLLLNPEDCLWDFGSGEPLHEAHIVDKWGVQPRQIPDFLALVGDPIDDIPGVPGIGKKTAAALLNYFTNVETLLAQRDTVAALPLRGAAQVMGKLTEYEQQIAISKQLATAAVNATEAKHINRATLLAVTPVERDAVENVFKQLGFPRLKNRLNALPSAMLAD